MGCGRIDYGQCESGAPEAQQGTLKFNSAGDAMDKRLGDTATAAPIRNRSLRVGVDYGDPMPVSQRGNRKTNGERALAAASFLRSQDDNVHSASPFAANRITKCRWQRFRFESRRLDWHRTRAIDPHAPVFAIRSFAHSEQPLRDAIVQFSFKASWSALISGSG